MYSRIKTKPLFKCPICGENIIREEGDETVVRNRILKTKKPNNITSVLCPRCGKEVVIPFKMSQN